MDIRKNTRVETTTTFDLDEEFIANAVKQELKAQGYALGKSVDVDFHVRHDMLNGATIKIIEVAQEGDGA